jgi:UDP-3-O-[3-hydroxymyristoyl] glucosamine N-acyltransferase
MAHRLAILCLLAAAFAACATPARADRDAVQFGSNINVAHDATVHDAVCFFCNANVEGKVQGDIVVIFGNIHLSGEAHHDVVSIFGTVTVGDNVSIKDDLVSIFGGIRVGENVSVGKDMVAIFGSVHVPESVSVGGDRVVQPGWVFGFPLLLTLLVFILVVREYRAHRRRQLLGSYQIPPHP